ncbi:acylneuraminate cytidylyltransferase, partial [Salmonella enterica]|nr:acylneuraminate cytidylyltransferase [Salmonella enterica]
MRVVGIIQARLGSTRLPKKMMMSLGQASVLEYVCKRALAIRNMSQVIVATTTNASDDELVKWCLKNDIEVFRGSEDDLLQRYLLCAQKYEADYIVRITGDCPFISIDLAENLIDAVIDTKCQYGYVHSSEIPIGLKVSVIETKTLEYVDRVAVHPYYREHITLYMDEHLGDFEVLSVVPFDYL